MLNAIFYISQNLIAVHKDTNFLLKTSINKNLTNFYLTIPLIYLYLHKQTTMTAEEYIKSKYQDADFTDKSGTINGNFWGGISNIMEEYAKLTVSKQWISVEERLPEIGVIVDLVLKHSKNNVYSGFRAKGGWYCFQIGENYKHYIPNGIGNVTITHWMPLPEPPIK